MAKLTKRTSSTQQTKRARGRPPGSRNARRERPAGAPLTVTEFCEHYAIGKATLYRHVMPKISVIKIGSRTLIPEAEAERYVASLIREPVSPKHRRDRSEARATA